MLQPVKSVAGGTPSFYQQTRSEKQKTSQLECYMLNKSLEHLEVDIITH